MSTTGGSQTIIRAEQVNSKARMVDGLMANIEWMPAAQGSIPRGGLRNARLQSRAMGADKVNLDQVLKDVRKDGMLNETEYGVLYSVRHGLQIAFAVVDEYKVVSGLDHIKNPASLTQQEQAAFQEKSRTAAAIALHVLATYVEHTLMGRSDASMSADHVSLPEISFDEPFQAFKSVLYYFCKNLQHPSVTNDAAILAVVGSFFNKVLEEIEQRKGTLKHLESFSAISFGIEGSDFAVTGLERHEIGATSVEFNRVEMDQIVGNADAKHFARRLVMRMLCYNVAEQKNVFNELGGLSPVWMGYGKPGTGKSMLIAATATMFDDYCRNLGIPFLFHPLPDNIIDSYQGNSAKNMVAWMKAAQDPERIVFMPVDDAENILEERTRQGVSEGVRAAIGVFLRYTEGAYAINRGNATIGVFTNLPEQIDAAVRSRIQGRMVIDGADTVEDFLDQDHLWLHKFADQDGFIDLTAATYEYMSAQRQLKSMADAAQTRDEPEHQTVFDIFAGVRMHHEPSAHRFFGNLYMDFMKRFPAFSSRDVRNIQSAVDQRIMDFDLPDEWFQNPETFCQLPYDRQKAMVLELRNANMQGLKFADIYRQEAIRYLDNYARIADAQFDREVEERVKHFRVQEAVAVRVAAKG